MPVKVRRAANELLSLPSKPTPNLVFKWAMIYYFSWFPGEGNGNPLQYFCLENSMDGGVWWATVHRVAESDMTEATEPVPATAPLVFWALLSEAESTVTARCPGKGRARGWNLVVETHWPQIQDCWLLHQCPLQACLLVLVEAYNTWQYHVPSTACPVLQALIWIRISFSGPLRWDFSPPL